MSAKQLFNIIENCGLRIYSILLKGQSHEEVCEIMT
jgi:hypothetical protein